MRKLFTDIWMILNLDCEASAKLTSDSFDRDLDWAERTAAYLHRLICAKSRKLDRQLIELNAALTRGQSTELSATARERIRAAIQQGGNSENQS